MRNKSFIIIAIIAVLFACKHEIINPITDPGNGGGDGGGNNGGGNDSIACFEGDVLPIFISNCAQSGCHDSRSHQDGYVLDSWENIVRKGIKPGDADGSKIYQAMIATDEDRMPPPPNAPLTNDQTEMVKRWINEGAKNTTNCTGCDTTNFSYAGAIAPILSLNCVGCHNTNNAGGGIDLSIYSGVQEVALNGRLVGSVTWASGFSKMPQGGNQLSDCNITQITKWVNDGAKNN